MKGDERLDELKRILSRVVESHVLPKDAYLAGFAYVEDAEKDASGIMLLDPSGEPRPMTGAEWASIKDFFVRFVR